MKGRSFSFKKLAESKMPKWSFLWMLHVVTKPRALKFGPLFKTWQYIEGIPVLSSDVIAR